MYIKDMLTGEVRRYGEDCHDSLVISDDGRYLTYENLHCGEGSEYADDHEGFKFVTDKEGHTPEEDEDLIKHGADAYFNIGGFGGDWEDNRFEHAVSYMKSVYRTGQRLSVVEDPLAFALEDTLRTFCEEYE